MFFAVLLATLGGRLAAHDYWFEPAPLWPIATETVSLQLRVGMGLQPGEEREFQLARARRLVLAHGAGRRDLRPEMTEGAKPFASLRLEGEGTQLIALERDPSTIELAADKFTDYLREEGLEAIVAERARRGESAQVGRERYARFLKCYLRVGDSAEPALPVADLRLDLAPDLRTDRAMQAGDDLRVTVRLDGAPLKHAAVFSAVRLADGTIRPERGETDDQGVVRVRLTAAGFWLVRLVHMQRAPAGDPAADWESFWAACTFGVK